MHVGVDGCKYGWAAACRTETLEVVLFRDFRSLLSAFPAANIFVDVPIGLPCQKLPTRACDVAARAILGKRHPTVFSPPCRGASRAKDIASARQLNKRELGRSLSAQAFAICGKIAEVDEILLLDQVVRQRVREIHPEVCSWALNSCKPLRFSKSKREGLEERISILSRYEPGVRDLLERTMAKHTCRDVRRDDVLDALVGYVVASASPSTWRTLGGESLVDQNCLPMTIVYAEPG